jgi:hypothetical protein
VPLSHLARRCRSALLALAVVTVQAPAGAAPPANDPLLTFRVVHADGRLAPGAYVYTTVVGDRTVRSVAGRADAAGFVTVGVPRGHAEVARRVAARQPVTLKVRVFDRAPGDSDLRAAYVVTSVNLHEPRLPFDLGSITGKTVTLMPDRTAFYEEAIPPTALAQGLLPTHGGPSDPQDEADCPDDGFRIQVCPYVVDYPEWSRFTRIPIATNHGAGVDMASEIIYRSTLRTTTSVATSVGASGFFEASGTVTIENERSGTMNFATIGPNANRRAVLLTKMKRIREIFCEYDFTTFTRHCQHEATYLPFEVHGVSSDSQPFVMHDRLNIVRDCYTKVDAYWDRTSGEIASLGYSLTLGPSEDAALAQGMVLHAQATVTGSEVKVKEYKRAWHIVNGPAYDHHFLFVAGGGHRYDRLKEGGGPGVCPESNPGGIWTAASDTDYTLPTNPGVPAETAEDAEEYAEDCTRTRPGNTPCS